MSARTSVSAASMKAASSVQPRDVERVLKIVSGNVLSA
jgi:hypothetical protein